MNPSDDLIDARIDDLGAAAARSVRTLAGLADEQTGLVAITERRRSARTAVVVLTALVAAAALVAVGLTSTIRAPLVRGGDISGGTWVRAEIDRGPIATLLEVVDVVVTGDDSAIAWARVSGARTDPIETVGIWRTTDAGRTWQRLVPGGLPRLDAATVAGLVVDADGDLWLATNGGRRGGGDLYRSRDDGSTWTVEARLAPSAHPGSVRISGIVATDVGVRLVIDDRAKMTIESLAAPDGDGGFRTVGVIHLGPSRDGTVTALAAHGARLIATGSPAPGSRTGAFTGTSGDKFTGAAYSSDGGVTWRGLPERPWDDDPTRTRTWADPTGLYVTGPVREPASATTDRVGVWRLDQGGNAHRVGAADDDLGVSAVHITGTALLGDRLWVSGTGDATGSQRTGLWYLDAGRWRGVQGPEEAATDDHAITVLGDLLILVGRDTDQRGGIWIYQPSE